MDMFYDSLPFAQKRRRHFHRFMQDVHAGLKENAGHQAPLARVADSMAAGVEVLCFDEF